MVCYSDGVMNTTINAAPAATIAGSPASSAPLAVIEQEVSNLRTQLEEAEHRATEARQQEQRKAAEELHAKALTIPGLLGVKTHNEAIAILRREFASPGVATPRASTKLSESTLAQMKAMLSATPPATLEATARACGCGIATVSIYKRRWGLAHAVPKVRAQKRGGKKGHSQLSDAKRNRLLAALSKPGAVISHIARRERVSRQTLHSLKQRLAAPAAATGG